MNKLFGIVFMSLSVASSAFALDANTVFNNQKKSAFPDTCEMQMKTTVTLPGMPSQTVNTSVINAGPDKSITTIESSMMRMKMIQNNGRMKVIDLKTGQTLPAQNMPRQNPADVTSQMGSPSDYKTPVKSGNLWKLVPKDASKPTLFYSEKNKRVVKMSTVVNGSTAEIAMEYCDASCTLPGTLKKTEISTTLPSGEKSTVVMEIVSAKARHILPAKMFNIE
ncbi:hypothetical protein [uncultured Fibrobacter sp.]|uniref:hypothetical protein n=1 Tax=uncultured Fibrobacter sp. TaxID=261512 RepID=UPI0025F27690|nr:hypothetical protein [uncultured Fibrobacter sp.]